MSYLIHLRQFEGPLGLLLYLIRKEEMDIFDINIGEITRQYLDYIRMMKELDLEVAGEFVAMASTLIHIKSRMLLPQYNEEGEVVEQEDPRKELVQKLLEYQRYQEASKLLYERPLLGRDVFTRGIRENFREEDFGEIITEDDGLFSLISAYRRAMRKAERLVHKVRPKVQSIAMRVLEIKEKLIVGTRVLLSELVNIGPGPARARLLITFLSMLELGRMGYVSLFQSETYGDIHVDPKKPIERNVLERVQEFESGDTEAVARSILSEANDATSENVSESQYRTISTERAVEDEQMSLEIEDRAILAEGMEAIAASEIADTESESLLDMASDEDILAAEAELETAERLEVNDASNVSTEIAVVSEADLGGGSDREAKSSNDLADDFIEA